MGVMVVVTVLVLVSMCVVVSVCVALIDHQRHALMVASAQLARVVERQQPTRPAIGSHSGAVNR